MSAVDPDAAVPPIGSDPFTPDEVRTGATAAFAFPNFTKFWVGALLSNSGTWVQNITVLFLVKQLTDSALWLGLAGTLQFGPIALMGPLGGALADRFHRRSVLIATQAAQAAVALALWAAWVTEHRTIGVLIPFVMVGSLITGINIPSWQAFVSELVPRHALLNAVTLNSAQFNAARLVGPALGGFVLASFGASWAFLINALSYLAVIGALLLIRVPRLPKSGSVTVAGMLHGFRDSMRYSRHRPGIFACFIVVVALGGLGSPMTQLFPLFASDVYHVDAVGLGWLGAAAGLGSVIAAPLIAGRGSLVPRGSLVQLAMIGYGVAVVAFGVSPLYAIGWGALVVTGAGYLAIASTLNTTIQIQVDEDMRGKVIALYVMLLTVALPVGSFVEGLVAQLVGPQLAVATFGTLFLSVYVWLRLGTDYLPRLDDERAVVVTD